jgi:hypothetical protein
MTFIVYCKFTDAVGERPFKRFYCIPLYLCRNFKILGLETAAIGSPPDSLTVRGFRKLDRSLFKKVAWLSILFQTTKINGEFLSEGRDRMHSGGRF